jgi:hypothetical protein
MAGVEEVQRGVGPVALVGMRTGSESPRDRLRPRVQRRGWASALPVEGALRVEARITLKPLR